MQKYIPLIGRILLSAIFIISGVMKIFNFTQTQQYMAAYGMPVTSFFLACALLIEILGGLSVLSGYKAQWGASVLAVYLIPTTLIFHSNFADQAQMIHFMLNLTIIGGLLMVTYFGPGPVSIDERVKPGEIA